MTMDQIIPATVDSTVLFNIESYCKNECEYIPGIACMNCIVDKTKHRLVDD